MPEVAASHLARWSIGALATFCGLAALFAANPATALASPLSLFAAPAAVGAGSCADAGDACTLANALIDANGEGASVDVTIDLAAGSYSHISIGSGGTEHSLTIDGAGASATMLTGASSSQTVSLSAGFAVTLENLGIVNGTNAGSEGGNVAITAGNVTIANAAISGGSAQDGGGIVITGATLTVTNTMIADNGATAAGGGIMIFGGSLVTVRDSMLSTNTATPAGGIDLQASSTLNLYDSTITASTGGAIVSNGTANVYGSTIAGNDSGIDAGGTFDLGGSVLAANGTSHDCDSGTIMDEGYNYADDSSCSGFSGTSHDSEGSLDLGTLGAHGGPTETIPLPAASQAYDVVPVGTTIPGDPNGAFCARTDQRGVPRTQGPATGCSAGAYQYAPPVVTGLSPRAALELGLPVTLSGYGLADVTSVQFGSTAATLTAQSAASLAFSVPLSLSLGSQPIAVTNPDGTTAVAFTAVASPSVATLTMAPGEYKVAYSQPVAVAGGAGPYTYSLTSGALPAGLSLSSSGVVSGTPTKAGGTAFAVKITDANGIVSPLSLVSLVIASPVVVIKTASLVIRAGSAPVKLACTSAPCTGTLNLTESVSVRVKGKLKTMTVVLGTVRYSLTAGQTATETLLLTPTGAKVLSAKVLRHAKKHPLHETLTANLSAGSSASRTVRVT